MILPCASTVGLKGGGESGGGGGGGVAAGF